MKLKFLLLFGLGVLSICSCNISCKSAIDNGGPQSAVTPTITSVIPNRVKGGAEINISGQNFGNAQDQVKVQIGQAFSEIVSFQSSKIVSKVPSTLSPGSYELSVHVGNVLSNRSTLRIIDSDEEEGEPVELERITWQERQRTNLAQITFDIPVQQGKIVEYHKGGQKLFEVRVEDPVTVAVASKPEPWGFYQFPNLYWTLAGQMVAVWNQRADDVEAYGTGGSGYAVSSDQGKTWTRLQNSPVVKHHELSNGDMLAVITPQAKKWRELNLTPFKTATESHGRTFHYFNHADLPADSKGVYMTRMARGTSSYQAEHNTINHPDLVRYADGDYLPVVWWGDMQNMSDGSVIAGIYPAVTKISSNNVSAWEVHFYRSTDAGRTWSLRSTIPYTYDPVLDPKGAQRQGGVSGFSEPSFKILADNTYLTVMRTADGFGHSPIYASNSLDQGLNWTTPKPVVATGVYPKLHKLDNGVIVMGSGRPGTQLRFATDATGLDWSDGFELVGDEGNLTAAHDAVTCGYTGFLRIDENSFYVIYSDFRHQIVSGELRKAIKIRKVTVSRQ